jgi:hypothetical protein
VSAVTVKTDDGISHGVPWHGGRGSAFRLETSCGLEFSSWRYAGRKYGGGRPTVTVANGGTVNCMTCLVMAAWP